MVKKMGNPDKETVEVWLCDHGYQQHGSPNKANTCTHHTITPTKVSNIVQHYDDAMRRNASLGVLKEMWYVGSPVIDRTMALKAEDFFGLLATQAGEIESHLSDNMIDKAIDEVVDIITISLNWLRNLGVDTPDKAAKIIQSRVRNQR
jgi:hypothetical protein